MQSFEWDAQKARRVLDERGIDFEDAAVALPEGQALMSVSPRSGEDRYVSLVEIRSKIWAVVDVRRGEALRIITVRRARQREEREYRKVYARSVEGAQKQD